MEKNQVWVVISVIAVILVVASFVYSSSVSSRVGDLKGELASLRYTLTNASRNDTGRVICNSDSNCGSSDYIGSNYCCSTNRVCRDYNLIRCVNPGTRSSSCNTNKLPSVIQTCQSSYMCVNGVCLLTRNLNSTTNITNSSW